MKKCNRLPVLIIMCIAFFTATAQITVVASGLSGPYGLAFDQTTNRLYVSQSADALNYKVSYIILNTTEPQIVDLLSTNIIKPTRLKISNDSYLYVVESDPNMGKISRANISGTDTPQITPYITGGLVTPMGLDLKNGNLYIGDFGNYAIKKLTPQGSSFQTTLLRNDLASDLIIDGNIYYYSNPYYGVFSNSITNPSPVSTQITTGISNPSSLLLNGDWLFISDSQNGSVYRVNLYTGSSSAQLLITGLNQPQSMVVYNNELYIAESGANRIVKFDLNSLNTKKFESNLIVTISPNPANDKLNIQTESDIKDISVYDILGKKVSINLISVNQIDLTRLLNGLYFIKITAENNAVFLTKFIKN
ncbi:T9SS type A sorting domain-containing protein [Flavobacterium silvisoli]|uniref:T9SS type A sorting domain-containing protein n=1 Tax=Flavobacterium silvisoli TaxID=2529433 RepID=A0A4Q9Z3I1_9FLAO|nr:T9SS type A sorting domain-containing protein [Flavobacterium silvisoli]TBX69890.1 T9SS type A sorting domain-containing protein [Flavobacterium silvisoli]